MSDNQPLTRKGLMQALGDFFEQVLAPYLEEHVEARLDKLEGRVGKVEGRVGSLEEKVDNLQSQVISIDRKLDLVAGKVTDHERKLAALS